jgi:DNA-binding NarL/FixJ family response regulator
LAVARIAKEIGASYLKPHGRGRRFTPEFRERIRQAVASGRPSAEIERELKIDAHTVSEMRHELGDFENRKHRTKLTPEQIQEAERQIRSGRRWRDVADEFDVSPSTLLNRLGYRKHGLKHFTPDEERQVLAAVRRGEGQRRIAIQLGRPRSSVSLLVHRLRKLDPTLPQRAGLLFEVRTAIINARIKGHHTFAHIAQTFSLSPGGVFRIIKRESERRGAA